MKWAPFSLVGIEEYWTSILRTVLRSSGWSKIVLENNAIPPILFSEKLVRTSQKAGAILLTSLGQVFPISIIFLLQATPREKVLTMRAWLKTKKVKIRSKKTKTIFKEIKTSRSMIPAVSHVSIISSKFYLLFKIGHTDIMQDWIN